MIVGSQNCDLGERLFSAQSKRGRAPPSVLRLPVRILPINTFADICKESRK